MALLGYASRAVCGGRYGDGAEWADFGVTLSLKVSWKLGSETRFGSSTEVFNTKSIEQG